MVKHRLQFAAWEDNRRATFRTKLKDRDLREIPPRIASPSYHLIELLRIGLTAGNLKLLQELAAAGHRGRAVSTANDECQHNRSGANLRSKVSLRARPRTVTERRHLLLTSLTGFGRN
jgi:hypothetical protein